MYGIYPTFIYTRQYTQLISQFKIEYMATTGTLIFYIGTKILSGATTILVMLVATPILLCLIYKRHRNECLVHYKSFILYVIGFLVYIIFSVTIDQYLLWV